METEPVQHVRERIRRVEKVRDYMRTVYLKVVRHGWIVAVGVGFCSGAIHFVHRIMHSNARIALSDYWKSMYSIFILQLDTHV